MGDAAQIYDFLYGSGSQHGETGLAGGHDIGVIAKDTERMTGNGSGCHVEHTRQQLTGDFIHIRNHQQKALR